MLRYFGLYDSVKFCNLCFYFDNMYSIQLTQRVLLYVKPLNMVFICNIYSFFLAFTCQLSGTSPFNKMNLLFACKQFFYRYWYQASSLLCRYLTLVMLICFCKCLLFRFGVIKEKKIRWSKTGLYLYSCNVSRLCTTMFDFQGSFYYISICYLIIK